jgi:hypothetical protein
MRYRKMAKWRPRHALAQPAPSFQSGDGGAAKFRCQFRCRFLCRLRAETLQTDV